MLNDARGGCIRRPSDGRAQVARTAVQIDATDPPSSPEVVIEDAFDEVAERIVSCDALAVGRDVHGAPDGHSLSSGVKHGSGFEQSEFVFLLHDFLPELTRNAL